MSGFTEDGLQISEIRFERNINLGNYQTARVGLTIVVNEGDDPNELMSLAREWAWKHLTAERYAERQG